MEKKEKKYEKKDIVISGSLPYPDDKLPWSEKVKPEFGMSVALAIQSEHFYRYDGGQCLFYTSREQFVERRAYAKGLQNGKKYTDKIATNGDLSFLNLDFRARSVTPKLSDIIVNGIVDRKSAIRASAIDPISQKNKIDYRKSVQVDMNAKPIIEAAAGMGVDIASMPLDQLPETDEELNIHMQMEYKPSIELSEELAIQTVLEENEFDIIIKPRFVQDLVVCGKACVKHKFVEGQGIVLEYVDVANKFESYSDDPFYRDTYYDGEMKQVLISDVIVQFPWLDTEEFKNERAQLEYSGQNWWTYQGINNNDRLKGTTNLMYFTYKTTRSKAQKIVKTETNGKEVEDWTDKIPSKGYSKKFDKVEKVEQVEFEGVFVLGTNILLKWEVCENMVRSKSNKQRVVGQYITVAPRKQNGFIESTVSRMIPFEDDIQIAELKGQQIIQKISPDGYQIDLDGLADMDLGDGKALTPIEHLNMLMQTGSIFTRSLTSSGDFNYSKMPIQELKTGDSIGKLNALAAVRLDRLTMMKEVIGLNNASDASSPDPDALVGVQKLAALNSNIATRHILDATMYITRRTAEAVSLRIADVIQYSPSREEFIQKIGATAVLDLDVVKNIHLSDFGIFIDVYMDYEERAKLEADLTKEIEKQTIRTEDKYRILDMVNMKQAYNYLAILRKRNMREAQKQKEQEFRVQSDENIRSAQAAEQAKQQTAQMQGQFDAQLQQLINQGLVEKELTQGDQNRKTLELKIQGDLQVAQITSNASIDKQSLSEDRKDKRTDIQATQQSELIAERSKENPKPIDFEAKNQERDMFTV